MMLAEDIYEVMKEAHEWCVFSVLCNLQKPSFDKFLISKNWINRIHDPIKIAQILFSKSLKIAGSEDNYREN